MSDGSFFKPLKGKIDSYFADPQRDEWDEILSLHKKLLKAQDTLNAFNALPHFVTLLNRKRQIVFVNSSLAEYLGNPELQDYLGKRPGELLGCSHSTHMKAGCGTSEACAFCGAVRAIVGACNEKQMVEDCHINRGPHEALDIRVWATPYSLAQEDLVLFTFTDISSEKRRRALERIFFHDVLNTAGSIRSIANMMPLQNGKRTTSEFIDVVRGLSERLLDEIQAQRIIANAEQDELLVNTAHYEIDYLLEQILTLYNNHELAAHKHIQLRCRTDVEVIETDLVLFTRVLGNMVKNALEASDPGKTVTIAVSRKDYDIRFQVHNHQAMPRSVQLQIFNRSFSTKGNNRGLGTYSMKMIGEKYLKGRIDFSSTPDEGTTFSFQLPISFPESPQDQESENKTSG